MGNPAHLTAEAIRAAKGLRVECGQLVNVLRPSRAEQRLEHRVGKDADVEGIDESAQPLMAARMPIQRLHAYIVTGTGGGLSPGTRPTAAPWRPGAGSASGVVPAQRLSPA